MGIKIKAPKIKIPSISQIGKDINRAANDIGKNIERSAQTASQGVALMASGDFNNAGRTLADLTLIGAGGVLPMMVNEKDKASLLGETAVDRKTQEALDAEKAKEAQDAQFILDEKQRAAEAQVKGMADTRRRTPGRGQTLITGPTPTNTLLTFLKGN